MNEDIRESKVSGEWLIIKLRLSKERNQAGLW